MILKRHQPNILTHWLFRLTMAAYLATIATMISFAETPEHRSGQTLMTLDGTQAGRLFWDKDRADHGIMIMADRHPIAVKLARRHRLDTGTGLEILTLIPVKAHQSGEQVLVRLVHVTGL